MKLLDIRVSRDPISKYEAILYNPETKRINKVPFGDKRYEQYHDKLGFYSNLDHNDPERRRLYRLRHGHEPRPKYSAAWFAWNFLW